MYDMIKIPKDDYRLLVSLTHLKRNVPEFDDLLRFLRENCKNYLFNRWLSEEKADGKPEKGAVRFIEDFLEIIDKSPEWAEAEHRKRKSHQTGG